MANPRLPGIPETKENLLYAKLNEYNRGRTSFKEAGAYLIVLPRPGYSNYSLWIFSPESEKQSILFIHDLSPDIDEALRMASTMFYFSRRCLLIMEYNKKRMQSNGDDIISFGKYHGHYLHEILKVDPAYISWVAYKFTPRIPKQERFVEIAKVYHSVHLDLMLRKAKQKQETGRFLGEIGEKLTDLTLKVLKVRIEDDPYKTRVNGTIVLFYVRQVVTLAGPSGNRIVIRFTSKSPSQESCRIPATEHEYKVNELVHIASARIARIYESHGSKYTRLNHVKLREVTHVSRL
ncbi:exodeoxyribonuclease X C-terminal domain-containing protein [Bacteroides sp.]